MNSFSITPDNYQDQLDTKIIRLKQQLSVINQDSIPDIEIFESPQTHYRMRAEFKVWHEGDESHYAMSDKETKKPVFLTEFAVAAKDINELMSPLMAEINSCEVLRKKLFQIEFLTTLTHDMLVTFIYHCPLSEEWTERASLLKEKFSINIIGRSRKQKIILDRGYVNEELQVNDKLFSYQQNEGSFTQPNAKVCEKMLSWAVNNSCPSEEQEKADLLELYCGNGNFTLPLAQNFRRVMATEIAKSSVNSAQENIRLNNIDNVTILRMSSEDFADAMDKVRPFRRLKDIDLDSYDFSSVFVDPPRAGLDDHTLGVIQQFDTIIYVSCNPSTLVDNLQKLCNTHKIKSLAAFDQFPYTDHLEAAVVLRKKASTQHSP
ncbi:MAG: tRNA (uracil-5-)-methyltransferase [Granulosicoccus sp.]|jgi:tRNA (uracil-5-)-methyltransferase